MSCPITSTAHSAALRSVSRKRQRGAAMVETAFMFPMFIILFFSMVYAHSYGAAQIESNIQSRQLAWNDAMSNCGATKASDEQEQLPTNATSLTKTTGNFTGVTSASSVIVTTNEAVQQLNGTASTADTMSAASAAIPGGSLEGALGSILGPILNAIAGILPNPQGAQATAKAPISWRLPNLYAGADPANSTTRQQIDTVPCNLVPHQGGVAGLFSTITGAAGGP